MSKGKRIRKTKKQVEISRAEEKEQNVRDIQGHRKGGWGDYEDRMV